MNFQTFDIRKGKEFFIQDQQSQVSFHICLFIVANICKRKFDICKTNSQIVSIENGIVLVGKISCNFFLRNYACNSEYYDQYDLIGG